MRKLLYTLVAVVLGAAGALGHGLYNPGLTSEADPLSVHVVTNTTDSAGVASIVGNTLNIGTNVPVCETNFLSKFPDFRSLAIQGMVDLAVEGGSLLSVVWTNAAGIGSRAFEESGAVYNPADNRLYVCGDDGGIASFDLVGGNKLAWKTSTNAAPWAGHAKDDFEALTLVDYASGELVIGAERFGADTDSSKIIRCRDFLGARTNTIVWDVGAPLGNATPADDSSANQTLEGLTFVPREDLPYWITNMAGYASWDAKGLFLAGVQSNGMLAFLNVAVSTSAVVDSPYTLTTQALVYAWQPELLEGDYRADIADVVWDREFKLLYLLYDEDSIESTDPDYQSSARWRQSIYVYDLENRKAFVGWELPPTNRLASPEGLAVIPGRQAFVVCNDDGAGDTATEAVWLVRTEDLRGKREIGQYSVQMARDPVNGVDTNGFTTGSLWENSAGELWRMNATGAWSRVVQNGATNLTLQGTFSGDGTGVTNVPFDIYTNDAAPWVGPISAAAFSLVEGVGMTRSWVVTNNIAVATHGWNTNYLEITTNEGVRFNTSATTYKTSGFESDELVPASFVRSLFAGGQYLYNVTNRHPENPDWYVASSTTNAVGQVRTYNAVTTGQYLGFGIMSTQRYTTIFSPMAVNAFMGFNTGGGRSVSVAPEFYYTYGTGDVASLLGDYSVGPQPLAGGSNMYSWVISYPTVVSTNGTGFLACRRMKVVAQTGNPNVSIYGSGNTPSSISFANPPSTDLSLGVRGATGVVYTACPAVTSATYNTSTREFTLAGPALGAGGGSVPYVTNALIQALGSIPATAGATQTIDLTSGTVIQWTITNTPMTVTIGTGFGAWGWSNYGARVITEITHPDSAALYTQVWPTAVWSIPGGGTTLPLTQTSGVDLIEWFWDGSKYRLLNAVYGL